MTFETVIAAPCGFAPQFVPLLCHWPLGVGWLDNMLFPALVFFTGVTVYALLRKQGRQCA